MASLDGTITFQSGEYRPCLVHGQEALFHRWSVISNLVGASPLIGGHPGGTVSCTLGIVEFESGVIKEVAPKDIVFTDSPAMWREYGVSEHHEVHREYWENKEKKKESKNE